MGGNDGATALLARNTGLALVRVVGEDATAFLNAQATASLAQNADSTQLSALADPQGRVLAVFYAWYEEGGWTLALAASEVEWLCAQLARFLFRARVCITAPPGIIPLGLTGAKASTALAAAGFPAPAEGCTVPAGALRITRLTGTRWLVTGETNALAETTRALEPLLQSADEDAWKRARFAANEVEIRAETRARFLPQMLGLVELGAVSFGKGCYPGQEVIARLQHRGRIKRKLALFRLDYVPKAGAKIELGGTQIEVLDSIAGNGDGALVQAVAPFPLPPALSAHLKTSDANA